MFTFIIPNKLFYTTLILVNFFFLLKESYERAKAILNAHHIEHKLLAEALLKYETLAAEDIKAILSGSGEDGRFKQWFEGNHWKLSKLSNQSGLLAFCFGRKISLEYLAQYLKFECHNWNKSKNKIFKYVKIILRKFNGFFLLFFFTFLLNFIFIDRLLLFSPYLLIFSFLHILLKCKENTNHYLYLSNKNII